MTSMNDTPLTVDDYRKLIDAKYTPTTTGWALIDNHGTIRGWHQKLPGDPHWDNAEHALHAFIPDSRRRAWAQRLGWSVQHDIDRAMLSTFLIALTTSDEGRR